MDDYVKALITTLRNDKTISPLPEDFENTEDFAGWRSGMRSSVQDLISRQLKYRFLKKSEPADTRASGQRMFFKVVSARNLVAKEGRPRDCFCSIEHGNLERSRKEKTKQVFQTEVIKGSLNPTWNQHLKLDLNDPNDEIKVEVRDKLKDHFLGQIVLSTRDLVRKSERNGLVSQWYDLVPRDSRNRDKYVGGEILIEAALDEDSSVNKINVAKSISGKLQEHSISNGILWN